MTVTVLMVVFAISTLLLYTKAVPFPDLGHRAYGVEDARAAKAMEGILSTFLGDPVKRFDAGPTHQIVFKDGTVILWLDSDFKKKYSLASSAPSFVCDDPDSVADEVAASLAKQGYYSGWFDIADWKMPGGESSPRNLLAIVTTPACETPLVFRRHILNMPKPKEWTW